MTKLYPPIGAIEEDLFSPSDRLIERWIDGGSALSDASRAALEGDPAAREKREIFEASNAQPPQAGLPTIAEAGEQAGMPPWLMEMIERRSAAGTRFSGPAEPMAGQLRLVDRAVGPDGGDLGWDMNRPLAVLLWRETEDPAVWAGWMASHESDYASYWDVLLEDGDQPCDPLVAMIQLWNPVHVYAESTGRVLGQLSEPRLAALVVAFADFLSGERPDASHARPGSLIDRLTTTGERIMTGTPVGEEEDPRRRYQDFYFAAAGLVKDVARLAVARQADEAEPAGDAWATVTAWLGQLVERLPAFAAGWAQPLEPVVPEAAMGEIPEVGLEGYRIPGLLEIHLIPSIPLEAEEDNAVLIKLGLRSLAETSLTVQLMQGSRRLQRLTLAPDSREEGIRVSPETGLRLEMNDGKGGHGTWDLSG